MSSKLFKSVILCALLSGCASIPKESVILSGEMTTMIASAKTAHFNLLDEYEVQRRGRIDDFMESTLIPRFVGQMAKDGDLWGKTCKIQNTKDSEFELAGFVQAAAKRIAAKRKEMTDELDLAMADLRERVRAHYATLEMAQVELYRNLRSVRANDEVTEALMKKNRMNPEALTPLRDLSAKLDKAFK